MRFRIGTIPCTSSAPNSLLFPSEPTAASSVGAFAKGSGTAPVRRFPLHSLSSPAYLLIPRAMKPTSSTYPSIRPEVAAKLGFYVYAYVDPRNSEIFYVGKGCSGRALAHLDETRESEKTRRIAELKQAGLDPQIDILAHGMTDEETALRVEGAVIDVLRPGRTLTNVVRGFRSLQFGRLPLSELEVLYGAPPVRIEEPALLIRINRLYRPHMTAEALYEATRGVWPLGERRHRARYGFAVFQGVVREVYEIQSWHPAGTTPYNTRPLRDVQVSGRWEFLGRIAPELSPKYRDCSVQSYLSSRGRFPITYVNC